MSNGDIVVGVDESPESGWAVFWAAREARLRGATLTLVHVRPSVSEDRAAGVDAGSEAERLLSVRAAEASELEPGITITPRLYESRSISEQLIELSGAADLVVVGVASARRRADHGVLGPVEDRVVVHAHCPVVTVNGPGPIVGQDYDKIVLGWTEGTTGRRALEAAADEAALRGSLLDVVSVSPAAAYTPAVPNERVSVEQALIDSIHRIESTHRGLRIDVTHRSGHVVREYCTNAHLHLYWRDSAVLLTIARLIQGLSVGGEYGTSATYLSEIAPANHRGFYSSFQYVTLIGGQLIALGVQLVLQQLLSEEQMQAWGWRIPFVIGASLSVVALYLRSTMEETQHLEERGNQTGQKAD